MTNKKAVSNIPKKKLKEVEDLKNLIKTKKIILLASIKNIPAAKFQDIGKKLRGSAVIKVPKKNLMFRALDSQSNEAVKIIKEHVTDSIAVLFSDLDAFDLAGELVKNKSPSKAKPGQIAPEDIEIPEGPTDLVPGPAISELGALGIQIQIDKGKISIKEPKVVAKKGEKISQGAADLMAKLDIKPFSVGFIPLCAFDTQENKLYLNIKIDREETLKDLKESFSKALAFAVEIEYITEDTIKFLISKAGRHEIALDALLGKENAEKSETLGEIVEDIKESGVPEEQAKEEEKLDEQSQTPEVTEENK
jgi:large subunit ribosomal protein L10